MSKKSIFFLVVMVAILSVQGCLGSVVKEEQRQEDLAKVEGGTTREESILFADAGESTQKDSALEKEAPIEEIHPILRLECKKISSYFYTFYKSYNDCDKDEDCRVMRYHVPASPSGSACDCVKAIDGYPDIIPKKYKEYELMEERFFSEECLSLVRCSYDMPHPKYIVPICTNKKCNGKMENPACY